MARGWKNRKRGATTWSKPHRFYPKRSLSRSILLRLGDKRVVHVSALAQSLFVPDWYEFAQTLRRMEEMGVLAMEHDRRSGRLQYCWLTEKGLWYARETKRLGFKEDGST